MFRHRFHEASSRRVHFDWFLLAFLAGSVNAGGFLAAQRFVTHVTGFATLFGIDAAAGRFRHAIGILSVPIFFLLGTMISAYLIDRRAHLNRHPLYSVVMGLVSFCLLIAAVGGHSGWFGEFGRDYQLGQDYILLALLCMASGLQNAALSTASRATVRTTHLTGITTDLGIGLVRGLSDPKLLPREMRLVKLRLGTILFFALGSAVGAAFFLHFDYLAFLVPSGIAGWATYEALGSIRRLRRIQRHSRVAAKRIRLNG